MVIAHRNSTWGGGTPSIYIRLQSGADILTVAEDVTFGVKAWGGNGEDQLLGGGGNDFLYGGDGADFIAGRGGNDTLRGGNGVDRIVGDSGNDQLYGDDGDDSLDGGIGTDTITGGDGFDQIENGTQTDGPEGHKPEFVLVGEPRVILKNGDGPDQAAYDVDGDTDMQLQFVAIDRDNDSISYSIVSGPGFIDATTGVYSWNNVTNPARGQTANYMLVARATANGEHTDFTLTIAVHHRNSSIPGVDVLANWDHSDYCDGLPAFCWVGGDGDGTTVDVFHSDPSDESHTNVGIDIEMLVKVWDTHTSSPGDFYLEVSEGPGTVASHPIQIGTELFASYTWTVPAPSLGDLNSLAGQRVVITVSDGAPQDAATLKREVYFNVMRYAWMNDTDNPPVTGHGSPLADDDVATIQLSDYVNGIPANIDLIANDGFNDHDSYPADGELVSGPNHGTLVWNEGIHVNNPPSTEPGDLTLELSVDYSPGPSFNGYDSFRYTVSAARAEHGDLDYVLSNEAQVEIRGPLLLETSVIYSSPEPPCDCPCSCGTEPTAKVNESSAKAHASIPLPFGTAIYQPPQDDPIVRIDYEIPDDPFYPLDDLVSFVIDVMDEDANGGWVPFSSPTTGVLDTDFAKLIASGGTGALHSRLNSPGAPWSGGYEYQVVGQTFAGRDATTRPRSFTSASGTEFYKNLIYLIVQDDIGFGPGWNLAGTDRLIYSPVIKLAGPPQTIIPPEEIIWIHADGYISKFDGVNTFANHDSSASFLTIDANGDSFILTDKYGTKSYFPTVTIDDPDDYKVGRSNVTSRVDRFGNTTTYSYVGSPHERGVVQSIHTSIDGHTLNFYDDNVPADGHVDRIVDFAGRETNLQYDAQGQLFAVMLPDPDGSGGPRTEMTYDTEGFIASIKDADGNTTDFNYSNNGFSLVVQYADFGVEQYVLTVPAFEPYLFVGARGPGHSGASFNSRVKTYDPGSTLQFSFQEFGGGRGFYVDTLGHTSNFTTDLLGYIYEWTDPLGNTTVYERNNDGLVERLTLPMLEDGTAIVEVYGYDSLNNRTSVLFADGTSISAQYDDKSRPQMVTDELGRTTTYNWIDYPDGGEQQVTTTHGISQSYDSVSEMHFRDDGLVSSIVEYRTDPDGFAHPNSVTSYTYNPGTATWLDSVTYPNGASVTVLARNAYGMPISVEDEGGRVYTYLYDALDRLTSATTPDPAGSLQPSTVTYAYTKTSRIDNEKRKAGGVTLTNEYDYDSRLRLEAVTNNYIAKNNSNDPPSTESDEDVTTRYEYDSEGNITAIVDPLQRRTEFRYDPMNRNISIAYEDVEAGTPVVFFAYDALGRTVGSSDPMGNVTRYDYDLKSRVTNVMGSMNANVGYQYDDAGQVVVLADPLGRKTKYTYDDAGRVTEVRLPGQNDDPIVYSYDSASNLVSIVDQQGRQAEFEFDSMHRATVITGPAPDPTLPTQRPSISYNYLPDGQVDYISEVYAFDMGAAVTRITDYGYDNLGRLQTITLPSVDVITTPGGSPSAHASVITYEYDEFGRISTVTDDDGNVTEFGYDGLHRRVSVLGEHPDGNPLSEQPETVIEYDKASQVVGVTEKLTSATDTRTTSYLYDGLGRLVRMVAPDPTTGDGYFSPSDPIGRPFTRWSYDLVGNTVDEEDASGLGSSMTYDRLHRIVSSVDEIAEETTYSYDIVGNLLSLTDSASNITTWEYDDLDRVITETNELGYARIFEYDLVGNLVRRTDRNGRVISLQYNNANQVLNEYWYADAAAADAGPGSEERLLAFTYDVSGRLTSSDDPSHHYDYTYDSLDRIAILGRSIDGLSPAVTSNNRFDNLGNLARVEHDLDTTKDGRTAYTYDALNRLTGISQYFEGGAGANVGRAKSVALDYDLAGQLDTVKRYDDAAQSVAVAVTDLDFDKAGRIDQIKHLSGSDPASPTATLFAGYDFSFNTRNQLTGLAFLPNGTNSPFNYTNESATFTYDDRGQLETADYAGTAIDESYEYESNGNRDLVTNIAGTNQDYSNTTNNRLASDGTFTYEYDHEGNRISRVETSTGLITNYSWDHRNRLIAVESGGVAEASHWTMNGGSVATDSGSNGLDGTLVNTVWQTGTTGDPAPPNSQDNTFLGLNGASARVALGIHSEFEILDEDLTFSMWFQIDPDSTAENMTLASEGFPAYSNDEYSGWILRFRRGYTPDRLEFVIDNGIPSQTGFATYTYIADNNLVDGWHHVAVTVDQAASTSKLYLDGVLRTTKTNGITETMPHPTSQAKKEMNLGYWLSYNPKWFYGDIDDVRMYRDVLDGTDIAAIYNNPDVPLPSGGQITVNTYDHLNQWITRTVDQDGNLNTANDATRTAFVHDRGQIVMQFDGSASADLGMSELSHRYLWGVSVDQLLADEVVDSLVDPSANETLWPLTDHLGSVRDIVSRNVSGQTVKRKHTGYDTFGNVQGEQYFDKSGNGIDSSHAEAVDQLFGYTGRPLDGSTGLQNNLHRWYDSHTGRWISEDPIGFWGGDTNLTTYVGNTPSNAVDASGLFDEAAFFDIVRLLNPDALRFFEKLGGRVEQRNLLFNKKARWIDGIPVIYLEKDYNELQAAEAFINRIEHSAELGGMYQASKVCNSDSYRDFQSWWLSHAAQVTATGAELYLSALSIANDGLDFVISLNDTIHGISEGQFARAAISAIGILPLIPGGVTRIVLSKADEFIVPNAVYRFMKTGVLGDGFRKFEDLKAALPPLKPDHSWHHIVQQHPRNAARFGEQQIHNTCNVIATPNWIHNDITRIQNSIMFEITGSHTLTVGQWIAGKSYKEQHEFGQLLFTNVLTGVWMPK
ncbi:MAG: hypothetical protein KDA99_14700 [Planctomycetales bacterium]|nr:hypothetical protein [Planctomycetales bacterium]